MKKEFSKRIVTAALVFAGVCTSGSYLLALLGREPVENLTIAVLTSVAAVPLGYFCKSAFEKNSRNKYGVNLDDAPGGKKGEV